MAELRKQESVDDTKKIVHTYPLLRVSVVRRQVCQGDAHLFHNYHLSPKLCCVLMESLVDYVGDRKRREGK